MAGYTPGAWRVDNDNDVVAKLGYMIADLMVMDGKPTEEDRANARLIAAAPDLLEALNGLIEEIDDCAQPSDWDFYDASRAAIARAKGGDT